MSYSRRNGTAVRSTVLLLAAATLCMSLCSCGGSSGPQGPPKKETVPVTGEVRVDGQAVADVAVTLNDVKGIDKENPTFPKARTDAEGRFQIYTYDLGDGAPEGTYKATFRWAPAASQGDPNAADKLKGRYSNAATSKQEVTVTKGTPVDMGTIELTTK